MQALWDRLLNLLQDPQPDYVFEVSEAGIAYARPGSALQFRPLNAGVIAASPLADNVLKPDAFGDAIRAITGLGTARKRGRAVLILPDYCARVTVLEFDQFPADPKEQLSLVKFRMKKSVPFDVDSAAISFHPQSTKGPTDVIVVLAALEIISRYEAPFRAAGLHPGRVTTSALAMAELNHFPGISIAARLSGRVLSVLVMNGATVKLVRTMELTEVNADEILAVLFPTVAYIEDEMSSHPLRLLLCGFEEHGRTPDWSSELGIPVEPLRSRLGLPDQTNAGLMGFLESLTSGVKAA